LTNGPNTRCSAIEMMKPYARKFLVRTTVGFGGCFGGFGGVGVVAI